MKRKRHTPEQIIRKLRTAEQLLNQGQTVADVCRTMELSAPTYHHPAAGVEGVTRRKGCASAGRPQSPTPRGGT